MPPSLAGTLASLLLLLCVAIPSPASAEIREDVLQVPVTVVDREGRRVEATIDVTVWQDSSRGRSPVAVLHHGRAGDPDLRRAPLRSYGDTARFLVGLGFVVLAPTRLGYGPRGGSDVEEPGACEASDYPPGYEAALAQTRAVLDLARTLPGADMGHVLVLGQSVGGAVAVAAAGLREPGLRATVNFAGGDGGDSWSQPDRPCRPDRLQALFAGFGSTARVPVLWLYSANDRYWGPTYPRAWFAAFTAAGGRGEFVRLPAFEDDGHFSFYGNRDAWRPAFLAFLAGNGFALAAGP
jgi:dienelactone hydrolase